MLDVITTCEQFVRCIPVGCDSTCREPCVSVGTNALRSGYEPTELLQIGLYGSIVPDSDHESRRSLIAKRAPRLWVLWMAARPSQIALILLVYLLGVGMATSGPPLVTTDPTADVSAIGLSGGVPMSVFSGAVVLIPVTITIHYANEYVDRQTDALTERTPFSGGSGALVRSGLPAMFLRSATIVAFVVTLLVSIGVVARGGLGSDAVVLLGAILILGLLYSIPPVAFIRRGVGELINAALGGIALPLYGIAVVASPTPVAVLAVVPFALVVGCNLLATHWPDRKADASVGKRTLAVRWSPTRLRRSYAVLASIATIAVVWLWAGGVFPDVVGLAHLVSLPFLVWGNIVLTRQRSPFPTVLAMVVLAVTVTSTWWWVGGTGG